MNHCSLQEGDCDLSKMFEVHINLVAEIDGEDCIVASGACEKEKSKLRICNSCRNKTDFQKFVDEFSFKKICYAINNFNAERKKQKQDDYVVPLPEYEKSFLTFEESETLN